MNIDNNKIKNSFPKSTSKFHSKIQLTLDELPEKKEIYIMNRRKTFKRGLAICAAAVLLIGTTAFAAGKLVPMIYSSSSSIPDYYSIPTEQELDKKLGYSANIIENFNNGFEFTGGNIVDNKSKDENGDITEEFKSFSAKYKNGDKRITLSIDKSDNFEVGEGTHTILADKYQNIDIYYTNYINKIVPPDYKLTEQDKIDEENGSLVFSYGSDDIETQELQSVSWVQEGITYNIMGFETGMSQEDFVNMAKEIIDYK